MQIKIRYRDTDSTGRIFFTRYLEFFDDAAIEFFRERGITFDAKGSFFLDGQMRNETLIVGECYCRFLAETFYDDLLEIITKVRELSEKKVVLEFVCHNRTRKAICSQGYMTFICFDTKTKKSTRIPQEVRAKL